MPESKPCRASRTRNRTSVEGRLADINRDRWPISIGMPRRHHRYPQSNGLPADRAGGNRASFFAIIGELFPEMCVVVPASSAGRSPSSLSPAWQSLPVAGLPPAFLAGAGYGVRRRLFS